MRSGFKGTLVLGLALLLALVLVPAAGAMPYWGMQKAVQATATATEPAAPTPVPVSGEWWIWGIEGPATEPSADGTTYIWGHEHGIWSGDFQGASDEPYTGWVRADGYVWAIITVKFKGTYQGMPGKFRMQLTVEEPPGGDVYGQWAIISGKGRLKDLRGAGTWKLTGGDDIYAYADYEGMVWMQ